MLLIGDLSNEIDFVTGPLILINGDLGFQLNFEGMILAYFEVFVLLGISTFDVDTQTIFLGVVVNILD